MEYRLINICRSKKSPPNGRLSIIFFFLESLKMYDLLVVMIYKKIYNPVIN
jgi:hypothetical protein